MEALALNHNPLRIEWDADDRRQIEESKRFYQRARREGRRIADSLGNNVLFFRPEGYRDAAGRLDPCLVVLETELKPDQFSVRVWNENGDDRIVWCADDPAQVKEAAALFDKYLKKGWRALAIDDRGHRRRIKSFDPESQEVVFEQTSLEDFAKAFAIPAGAEGKDFIEAMKREHPSPTLKEKFSGFVRSFKKIEMPPRTYPG